MEYLDNIGKRAQAAKPDLQHLKSEEKNQILRKSADDLKLHATEILAANEKDMEKGRTNGMSQGLLDRLLLTEDRIAQIAEGLYQIAALDDPIGEVLGMKQRPNGLRIGQKRVPLGVVGIIYEARPNVTADAFGLCFKTGNVVILKGGSDAFHSIQAIVTCIRRTLSEANGCSASHRRYLQKDYRCIHETEPVCGCSDSARRCRSDPRRCGKQHDPGH